MSENVERSKDDNGFADSKLNDTSLFNRRLFCFFFTPNAIHVRNDKKLGNVVCRWWLQIAFWLLVWIWNFFNVFNFCKYLLYCENLTRFVNYILWPTFLQKDVNFANIVNSPFKDPIFGEFHRSIHFHKLIYLMWYFLTPTVLSTVHTVLVKSPDFLSRKTQVIFNLLHHSQYGTETADVLGHWTRITHPTGITPLRPHLQTATTVTVAARHKINALSVVSFMFHVRPHRRAKKIEFWGRFGAISRAQRHPDGANGISGKLQKYAIFFKDRGRSFANPTTPPVNFSLKFDLWSSTYSGGATPLT